MRQPFFLIKNLVLLAIVILSVYWFFTGFCSVEKLLMYEGVLGILFLGAGFMQLRTQNNLIDANLQSFEYHAPGYYVKRIILLVLYIGIGSFLFITTRGMKMLGLLLIILFINETISILYRIVTRKQVIAFESNYFYYNYDTPLYISANQIKEIEYRYEIFYITLNDNGLVMIETDKITGKDKDNFLPYFTNWMQQNEVNLTTEAKQNLNIQW